MRLLCSCFLRMCYCTQGRLHFCGYMRGSSQLSSGSSQLSSARALLCVSTLKTTIKTALIIMRMQYLNVLERFSGKNSILNQLAIRPIFPNLDNYSLKRCNSWANKEKELHSKVLSRTKSEKIVKIGRISLPFIPHFLV